MLYDIDGQLYIVEYDGAILCYIAAHNSVEANAKARRIKEALKQNKSKPVFDKTIDNLICLAVNKAAGPGEASNAAIEACRRIHRLMTK